MKTITKLKSYTNDAGITYNIGDTIRDGQNLDGIIIGLERGAFNHTRALTVVEGDSGWPLSTSHQDIAERAGVSTVGKTGWYQTVVTGPYIKSAAIIKRRMPTIDTPPAPVETDDKLGRWFIMEDGMHKDWMNDYGVAEGSIGYVIAKAEKARSYRVGFPYVGEVIIHENFLKVRVNPFTAVGYPKGVIEEAAGKITKKKLQEEFSSGYKSGLSIGAAQERNRAAAAVKIANSLRHPKVKPTTPIRPTAPMARAVLEMIEKKGTISALEAGGVLKCRDLPKRISELRQLGWNIQRELKNDPRDGQRYARYYLLRDVNPYAA